MRLFLAIYPGDRALQQWEKFQKSSPAVPLRWIPTEALHLTLKFLGETEASQETKVLSLLQPLTAALPPFSLSLRGGGVFPLQGKPSIFWVGVLGDTRILTELATLIELEMKKIGFPVEERDYHPHLTVARLNHRWRKPGEAFGQQFCSWVAPFRTEMFPVKEVCLVESRLGSTGSTYTVRHTFPLGGHPQ